MKIVRKIDLIFIAIFSITRARFNFISRGDRETKGMRASTARLSWQLKKKERKKKKRGKHDEQPCLTLDEAWNIARNNDGDVALCETTLVDVGKIKIHPLFVLHPLLRDTDAWNVVCKNCASTVVFIIFDWFDKFIGLSQESLLREDFERIMYEYK